MNEEKYLRSNDYRLGYNDGIKEVPFKKIESKFVLDDDYRDGFEDAMEAVEQIKGWTKYEQRPQIDWKWLLLALILGVIVSACIINVSPSINY